MDEEILKEYARNVQAMINDLNLRIMHLTKKVTGLEGQIAELLDSAYNSRYDKNKVHDSIEGDD